MPLFFPQDFLEDLRARAEIVECIGDYIPLARRGNSYVGLCPFHTEKTPSFSIDSQKQLYYCFGCGAGGDLFRFIEQYERVEFPEAVEILAHRYGLPLPEVQEDEKQSLRKSLHALNEDVLAYFRRNLHKTSGGRRALGYLADRGFERETLERFQIGYAPEEWENLYRKLKKEGISEDLLLESGLIIARENKRGLYDRFRNRIIFPIWTHYGKVAGFGGRILGDGEPKYLNSPQTLVYDKGQLLYGLNVAKKAIQEEGAAVLVEGYLDAIRIHQAGFQNVVGALGTSFTTHQARMLRRYAPLVLVNFDADAAGEAATRRTIQELIAAGVTVQALVLPHNLDPDDFIHQHGADAYEERLAAAIPFFDYLIQTTLETYDLSDVRQKRQALETILPFLCQIKDRIERTSYLPMLRDRFQIDHQTLLEELKAALDRQRPKLRESPSKSETTIWEAERRLIKIFLEGDDADRNRIRNEIPEQVLSAHEIWTQLLKENTPSSYSELFSQLASEDEKILLSTIAFQNVEMVPEGTDACLNALRKELFKQEKAALQRSIEQESDDEKQNQILEKIQEIGRQIDKLN